MPTLKIWWVRRDLRVDDNAALARAASRTDSLIPVFIGGDADEGDWPIGGAQRWWLARSLVAHAAVLSSLGSRLVILQGDAAQVLSDLAKKLGATEVVWSRRFDPAGLAAERRVIAALDRLEIDWTSHISNHLFDPEEIGTREDRPYQVFTPFARNCRARKTPRKPRPAPATLPPPLGAPVGVEVAALELEPTVDWAGGLRQTWSPGEHGARDRLKSFADSSLMRYSLGRDEPANDGTSALSPHLAFGEIGIRRIWHAVAAAQSKSTDSVDKFHAELLWREFATHVLFHFPGTDRAPLRRSFSRFPWRCDREEFLRWRTGRTGYPLVDAGMRQLWHTGWMHNRVRMVVASFLVKHLLLPWQDGAKWFWDTLVDADLANNTMGWQWAAGCGADAAPYFRIFNPTAQAQRFDGDSEYARRWIPELRGDHATTDSLLRSRSPLYSPSESGRSLEPYPGPMVDHAFARTRALAALASVRK